MSGRTNRGRSWRISIQPEHLVIAALSGAGFAWVTNHWELPLMPITPEWLILAKITLLSMLLALHEKQYRYVLQLEQGADPTPVESWQPITSFLAGNGLVVEGVGAAHPKSKVLSPIPLRTYTPLPDKSHHSVTRLAWCLAPVIILVSCDSPSTPTYSSSGGYCHSESRLEESVCLIDTAAKGASQGEVTKLPRRDVYTFYAALAAMNYVQTITNTARYSHFKRQPDFRRPINVEQCLRDKIGICGNQIDLFVTLLTHLDIKSRLAQFYYTAENGKRASHAAAEVYFNDKWNYVDVTWGAIFPMQQHRLNKEDKFKLKSLSEILARYSEPKRNENNEWYVYQRDQLDVFYYLRASERSIVIDGEGTIVHRLQGREARAIEADFAHIPNYVGDNRADGDLVGVDHQFGLRGRWDVTLSVSAIGGCSQGSQVYLDDVRGSREGTTVTFKSVEHPHKLHVRGPDDMCYFVIDALTFAKR